MNYYVIVEGVAEKKIYQHWIKYVNPGLTYVDHYSEFSDNNYVIIMGGGYPNYLSLIVSGIEDILGCENRENIRLVCSGDSEELTLRERYDEIEECIVENAFEGLKYSIIVQHFCFEVWALGNRLIGPRNPVTAEVRDLKRNFDVLINDPEDLSAMNGGTRASHAAVYLRALLRDKSRTAVYSKGDPSILFPIGYFNQLKLRRSESGHIKSFDAFSTAFI